MQPVEHTVEVVKAAPAPVDAKDFYIGHLEQHIRHMAARETRNAGYQNSQNAPSNFFVRDIIQWLVASG
jgi:hypothetical protein